jgi:ATP-dependent DNA helicase Q4
VVDVLEGGPKPRKGEKSTKGGGSKSKGKEEIDKDDSQQQNKNNYPSSSSSRPRKARSQNIYRKRFRGSGGRYGKGGAKVTNANFCQVKRTGKNWQRRGGRKGGSSTAAAGRKRNEFVPFDTLVQGELPLDESNKHDGNDGAAKDGGGVSREEEEAIVELRRVEVVRALQEGQEEDQEGVTEVLKDVFGFSAFRDGQLTIIKRILKGMSTLAIMPTGHGKSLLYQLPALLMDAKAPVIVISPLLALMRDQMSKLPKEIPHGMLCSGQSTNEALDTLQKIRMNKIKVIFVSPERLYSKAFIRSFQCIGEPPPFVCIDEAHCISEWGHSFRPAYFRLGRILYEDLKVKTILALTATATTKTISSICKVLELGSDSVVKEMPVRKNLHLHTSELKDQEPFQERILEMLRPKGCLESRKCIIIYCNFQLEAEQVAAHLYTRGINAKAYHAKMTLTERNRVQDLFCKGKIRAVVATVAFGMGLDKHDVDAVIHSEMPRSVEEYVQQIGRAGRDGRDAACHAFFSEKGYKRLKSFSYSDEIDESSIYSLLCKLFKERTVTVSPNNQFGILPLNEASMELDIKESTIEMILAFLEEINHSEPSGEDGGSGDMNGKERCMAGGLIRLLQPLVGHVCDFVFFESDESVLAKHPLVEHIRSLSKGQPLRGGHYTIELSKLAEQSKMTIADLQECIRIMQQMQVVHCRLKDPALCYRIYSEPKNKRALAQQISNRLRDISKEGRHKLDCLYKIVTTPKEEEGPPESEDTLLKASIRSYFEQDKMEATGVQEDSSASNHKFISRDIRVFIQGNQHLLKRQKLAPVLTGRAIARIMHGLSSTAYPPFHWRRNTMWARYADVDFDALLKAANREMVWYLTNKASAQSNK